MKKIYWIAGLCCLAGIVLLGISFSIIQGDFTKLNSGNVEPVEERTYESSDDITKIYIKDYSGAIKVKSSDVSKPVVKYCESNKHKYTITEEDGVLRIEKNSNFNMALFSIDFNRYEICVMVPKDYDGILEVENTSGSITISDIRSKELTARNTSGSIELKNVTADGNVTAKNVSGSIRFDRLSATKDITMTNVSGSIKGSIAGSERDYRITAINTSGSCNLNNSTSGSKALYVKNTSGSIKIEFID